jgi:hypothetical protein
MDERTKKNLEAGFKKSPSEEKIEKEERKKEVVAEAKKFYLKNKNKYIKRLKKEKEEYTKKIKAYANAYTRK